MATLSLADVKYAGRMKAAAGYKTSGQVLNERAYAQASSQSFDVFLSHSYKDAQVDADAMLGVYKILSDKGVSVYVDWIVDRELDRTSVTSDTAEKLRARMRQSLSLLFVTSQTSDQSKWMPWELGYFDGYKGRVAILPLTGTSDYRGQEYLGLYPYLDVTQGTLYIQKDSKTWVNFDAWLKGSALQTH